MTDKDRYVDETLKKQIQESFGATDAQLKARMDRIEKTLTDDEFAGAEDRMMAKFMARLAAEEKKETVNVEAEEVTEKVETESEVTPKVEVAEETSETEVTPKVDEEVSATTVVEEKVVRFGRKKVILVAALAAAFVGALAMTGIGENSYFFREDERRVEVIFDSGKNISDVSSSEEAYSEIKKQFNEKIISLNYMPLKGEFESLRFEHEKAIMKFNIDGTYIYFIQWKRNEEASINKGSSIEDIDIKQEHFVKNEWLNQNIYYGANELENGEIEYQTITEIDGIAIYIFGKVDKAEFENILKNLYFY